MFNLCNISFGINIYLLHRISCHEHSIRDKIYFRLHCLQEVRKIGENKANKINWYYYQTPSRIKRQFWLLDQISSQNIILVFSTFLIDGIFCTFIKEMPLSFIGNAFCKMTTDNCRMLLEKVATYVYNVFPMYILWVL